MVLETILGLGSETLDIWLLFNSAAGLIMGFRNDGGDGVKVDGVAPINGW
jgi:hypothetical protein